MTRAERESYFFSIAQNSINHTLADANMLLLSKEATDKDRSLKTQLLVTSNDGQEKFSGENVWKHNGFFQDLRPNLKLEKKNIAENTLFYINQSFLLTVKNGDIAMYNHNFILGQLIVAANQPSDINAYEWKENEVKLWCCIYDLTTGEFQGVREQLAHIVLRGDKEEVFFSYGFDSAKSKFPILTQRMRFQIRFFQLSLKNIILKSEIKKEIMKIHLHFFFFLPSITD